MSWVVQGLWGVEAQIAKLLLVRRRGPHGDLITVLSFGGTRLIIQ